MKQPIQNISIVGYGNVGTHLAVQLHAQGLNVSHVCGRDPGKAKELAHKVNAVTCTPEELPEDQLAIICVPDDRIAEVLIVLPESIPAAYTSGSVELNSLPERKKLGVFYPLQTFRKSHATDISVVPFFIESNSVEFGEQLTNLAKQLSSTVSYATSEERKKLHLAAVWVNNFTNHILYNASTYASENNIDFRHLLPLLKETVLKLEDQSAYDAQTGPARRGDEKTIQAQSEALQGYRKEIYDLLTKSIQHTYLNDE